MTCPNCLQDHRELPDVCILAALGRVLVERGYDTKDVKAVMERIDSDEFWDLVGPVVDWMEDTMNKEDDLELEEAHEE